MVWQGLDGPVEFSAGPFFIQETDHTFALSLEQIWNFPCVRVTASQRNLY
jgi:hypothetical protein